MAFVCRRSLEDRHVSSGPRIGLAHAGNGQRKGCRAFTTGRGRDGSHRGSIDQKIALAGWRTVRSCLLYSS